MSRVTIHNQKDRSFPTLHQSLEKLYEHRNPNSLWANHEPQLTLGGNRRYHVQGKPLARLAHHRGLTDRCPSGPRMKVRTNPGLTRKENLRSLPFCPSPNLSLGSRFALENHITYQRELKLSDPLRVTLQLLDHDEERFTTS